MRCHFLLNDLSLIRLYYIGICSIFPEPINTIYQKPSQLLWCRHSSVNLSAPTILLPCVRVPSTSSTLLSFMVKFVIYLSRKRTKINKKRPGLVHKKYIKTKNYCFEMKHSESNNKTIQNETLLGRQE